MMKSQLTALLNKHEIRNRNLWNRWICFNAGGWPSSRPTFLSDRPSVGWVAYRLEWCFPNRTVATIKSAGHTDPSNRKLSCPPEEVDFYPLSPSLKPAT